MITRCGAIMLLILLATQPLAAAPLLLGVHPYLPVEELQKRFTPLAENLGRAIGQKIVVLVGSSYGEHIHAVGGDKVDIAFMGPASYVLMTERYGPKPLWPGWWSMGNRPLPVCFSPGRTLRSLPCRTLRASGSPLAPSIPP